MTPARLFVYRFRRPLAAASAALAVIILATGLRPASPDRVDVVVAATDLPAGITVGTADVEVRSLPTEAVMPGTPARVDDVTGRTIVGPIAAGEQLSATRLLETAPRADGLRLVPVRISDAEAAGLLAPGVVVDLVAQAGDSRGGVIAEAVRVVTVPRSSRDAGLGSSPRTAGSLIIVATDPRTAIALASTAAQAGLGIVMR